MHIAKNYGFGSLLDDTALNETQRRLVNSSSENQACDPCNCNCNSGCDNSCRCN